VGVARAGFRQSIHDGKAVVVGLKRAGKVALRHRHVADYPAEETRAWDKIVTRISLSLER